MADHRTLHVDIVANAASYRAAMRDSGRETREFGREADAAGRRARRLTDVIDSMSGRIGLLVKSLLAIGPALAPLSTTAVAGVAGLANQTAFAALGAGAMTLAFQGMGGALDALNEYSLEPTTANLEKVREELNKLAPEAAQFALELHDARDELQLLQEAAAAGFFPGAGRGLDELLQTIPILEELASTLGSATGSLTGDLGEDLSSDRAREFIAFVNGEARPAMTAAYETTRNLAGGLAEMWMAFAPLNHDFNMGMVAASERFDGWASGLAGSEEFEDFLAYVRETGPEAAETLGAFANAALQIGEAAAPMGGPVLDALEGVANAVAAIADSPLGPPLLAATSAMSALSIATRTFGATSGTAWATAIRGQQGYVAQMSALRGAGKGAAVLGGMVLATSELGQQVGLTNTALYGSMGLIAGPWGAAVGAGAGLLLDFKDAAKVTADETEHLNRIMNSSAATLDEKLAAYVDVRSSFKKRRADDNDITGLGDLLDDAFSTTSEFSLPGAIAGAKDKNEALRQSIADASADWNQFMYSIDYASQRMGSGPSQATQDWLFGGMDLDDSLAKNMGEITDLITRLGPAMDSLGYTVQDIFDARGFNAADTVMGDLINEMNRLDSSAGRVDGLTQAIAGLDDQALTTADSAGQLAAALDAVMTPNMNAMAAADQWTYSLRHMGEGFKGDSITGISDSAINNRSVIFDQVKNMQQLMVAQAEAGMSSEQFTVSLARQRKALIDSAAQAGLSRRQVARLVAQMGLTPRAVRTMFEAQGLQLVSARVRRLQQHFLDLKKPIIKHIRTYGIPKIHQDFAALENTLGRKLTKEELKIIARLDAEKARTGIEDIDKMLKLVHGKRTKPVIKADNGPAKTAIDQVNAWMNDLNGKTATTYIHTQRSSVTADAIGGIHVGGVRAFATGGIGAGGRYYDRVPQIVGGGANVLWGEQETGWEAYISGKPSHRQRNVEILGATASRFGYGLRRFGSEPAYGGGGAVNHHYHSEFPAKVRLNIGGKDFVATVDGIAENAAKRVGRSGESNRGAVERMNW